MLFILSYFYSPKPILLQFKVTVSTPYTNGEAFANVSVLPRELVFKFQCIYLRWDTDILLFLAKRINQAPVAIITPPSQVVKLPNTGAVLDGSESKDDDGIISYHWELQLGPIGYQPNLIDTPTLQLDNLIPGNYSYLSFFYIEILH